HADHHSIGFDAGGKLLVGNDGGIWRLDDLNSAAWTDLNGNLQITQFVGIALDPTTKNVAYGGSQDNGREKYTGNLAWNLVFGGDGGFMRVDANNPQTIYGEYVGLSLFQRSDDGGTTWTTKTDGIGQDPSEFYVPYIIDASNPNRLLLGSNRVYETTNRADSWTAISSPNSNGWSSSAVIEAIGAASGNPNTIYATTAD